MVEGLRLRSDLCGALEFGSAARGNLKPNDYDVIVVATQDFIIPRDLYRHLSALVLEVKNKTGMRVEMLLNDTSFLSSPFSTFGKAFRMHLNEHGRVIVGEDIRPLLTNNFSESISGFVNKVPDFGLFVEALEWESHRLASARKHGTMLTSYMANDDKPSIGRAMSKLKMAEHARNVAILNGVFLRYEDKEGTFKKMEELYGLDVSKGIRRIEDLRSQNMPLDNKVGLFYEALRLREQIARNLVTSLRRL